MVVIITDGCENSSREYNLHQIKAIIERQKEKYGWEFIFLGANIDAIAVASHIGISADRAATYRADSAGTRENFESVSTVASYMRSARPISADWKKNIERLNK